MPRLLAKYRIEIHNSVPIRVPGSAFKRTGSSDDVGDQPDEAHTIEEGLRQTVAAPHPICLAVNEFDVQVVFLVPLHIYDPDDSHRQVITTLSALEVQISREVEGDVRLETHRPEYDAVLRTVVGNFVAYSRYVKRNLLLRGLEDLHTPDLRNAVWTLDGVHLNPGTIFLEGRYPSDTYISQEDRDHLKSYLINPPTPELHEVLLAEARDARALRDVRRTVIDLAIVCEVLLKTSLFGRDQVAASVIENLEEHNVLRASLKELLAAAGRAFGSSLSETDSKAHSDILALYDVRSRIVHHGRAEKKVDGKRVPVEPSDVAEWFAAVSALRQWLADGRAAVARAGTQVPDV
jgi:hypothetical protein